MFLTEILHGVDFEAGRAISGMDVSDVTDDSRAVKEGSLFIAVKGCSDNGHRFINEAVKMGARIVVAEEDFNSPKGVIKILTDDTRRALSVIADNFWLHPSNSLKTVGVTGTNGKTTVTYIMESILRSARKKSGVIGTINHKIGERVISSGNTTPGALELQALLAQMVKSGLGYVAMEVSSHSLDQQRVNRIGFDVAIFTNLTSDHMDYHKNIKNYFRAKSRLFDNLKKGGTAVLNNDDKRVASLEKFINGKVLTYGMKKNAAIMAGNINLSLEGSKFTVVGSEKLFDINTRLIGMHNVSNILAAIAASTALGIRPQDAKKGIEAIVCVPGRLEPVELGQPFKVYVDYAHTEDALFNVLNILRNVRRGRILTVFGCGGNRDKKKRPLMGRVACRLSDHVLITSDNPRFEKPSSIIEEIEQGIRRVFSNYEIVEDRREAIGRVIRMASPHDIVLIAGKGHERYQIIEGRNVHFDDREITKEALTKVFGEIKGYNRDNQRQTAIG